MFLCRLCAICYFLDFFPLVGFSQLFVGAEVPRGRQNAALRQRGSPHHPSSAVRGQVPGPHTPALSMVTAGAAGSRGQSGVSTCRAGAPPRSTPAPRRCLARAGLKPCTASCNAARAGVIPWGNHGVRGTSNWLSGGWDLQLLLVWWLSLLPHFVIHKWFK